MPGEDRRDRAVRLFTWLEGAPLGGRVLTPAGLRDLGRTMARLAMRWPASRTPPRTIRCSGICSTPRPCARCSTPCPKAEARGWVAWLIDRFEARVLPVLADLPQGVIHNDLTGSIC